MGVLRVLLVLIVAAGFTAGLIYLFFFVIGGSSKEAKAPPRPLTAEERTAGFLYQLAVQSAKDPSSVRFNHIVTPNGRDWCVQYSGTNSFNARVTEQFTYDAKTAKVNKSSASWNAKCANGLAQGTDFAAGYNLLGR